MIEREREQQGEMDWSTDAFSKTTESQPPRDKGDALCILYIKNKAYRLSLYLTMVLVVLG